MKEKRERRIAIRVRESAYAELKRVADMEDLPVSTVARRILDDYVQNTLARSQVSHKVKEGTQKKDTK